MQRNFQLVILATITILMSISCSKSQSDKDRETIESYIATHNIAAIEYQNTGLFYVIEKTGGSVKPSYSSDIEVNYDGYLTDGTSFDSGDSLHINLAYTIQGWQLGIPLIGEGGRIKLIIPSTLGYGAQQVGNIPKNSVLIFDVDLILFN